MCNCSITTRFFQWYAGNEEDVVGLDSKELIDVYIAKGGASLGVVEYLHLRSLDVSAIKHFTRILRAQAESLKAQEEKTKSQEGKTQE
jgi:hypothetical protein